MQYIHRKVTVGINISVLRQSLRAASTRLETASTELRKTLGPSPSTSVWERQWLFYRIKKRNGQATPLIVYLPSGPHLMESRALQSYQSREGRVVWSLTNQEQDFQKQTAHFQNSKSDSFRHARMRFYDWNRPDRPNLVIEGGLISELSSNRFLLYLLMWRFDSSVGE